MLAVIVIRQSLGERLAEGLAIRAKESRVSPQVLVFHGAVVVTKKGPSCTKREYIRDC